MEDPNIRFKFFVQVSHGKRSFQLRKEDVNEKKIALMSAMASFSLLDATTKQVINHDKDGNFAELDHTHEYEVILKKEVHESSDGFYKACSLESLKSAPNQRLRLPINERDITLITYRKPHHHHHEKISAIDSVCYHLGGPLIEGDIEDIDKYTCIICPWHRYRIDLETGEGLYNTPDGYCSKGEKQRVHETKIEGGFVYVKLKEDGELPSDHYAYMGLYKQPVSKTPIRVPVHSKVVSHSSENSN